MKGPSFIRSVIIGMFGLTFYSIDCAAASLPAGSYYVNPSALNPTTSNPVTLTGCANQSPISISVDSAPQCVIPAAGTIVSQAGQGCCLGGSASTCQTIVSGSTIIVNGGLTSGGGTCTNGGGGSGGGGSSGKNITIINDTSTNPITVYMGFVNNSYGCYSQEDFASVCTFNTSNNYICQFPVSQGTPVTLNFNQSCQVSVAFTTDNMPWGACPTSLAEFTLNGSGGDTIDVSLVNGINHKININTTSNDSVIDMTKAAPPYNTILGVYPPGCDICTASSAPPTWPGCPGVQPASNCQAGTQYNPSPGCQITRATNSDSYNVTFTHLN